MDNNNFPVNIVIADEYVDPTYGTGALKVTPAHDVNDYELGRRHGLQVVNVLNKDVTMNEQVCIYLYVIHICMCWNSTVALY